LGDLPGGDFESFAYGVSADGSVVVGASAWGKDASREYFEAFRWTADGGMVGMGDLPGSIFYSVANGVSADGSVVMGQSFSASGYEVFRWTATGGMVGLGIYLGGGTGGCGVSADGSVIVGGSASANGYEAFRWTAAGGMVSLGVLPGNNFFSEACGVSADGSVVVGMGTVSDGAEAFRWTEAGGMVGLGDLPGGAYMSWAHGVSADGSVVVGRSESANSTVEPPGLPDLGWAEAFRWTADGGMVGLGDLAGGGFLSWAYGASADGSVVVGSSVSASGQEAFIWDAANNMRSLKDVLVGQGLDLTGWTLEWAEGVSGDGRTIVGCGINPDGNYEAWVAVVPEPATLGLLAVGGLALVRRRRKFPSCAVRRRKIPTTVMGVTLTMVLAMALCCPRAEAAVFDLNANWSDTTNPNGPWSYNEGNNVLSNHVNAWEQSLSYQQPAWADSETGTDRLPAWFKATGVEPGMDWQIGDIVVHTHDYANGVGNGTANLTWRSPLDGTADVSGFVWIARDIGRAETWDLYLNEILLTSGEIFSGDPYDRANPFYFSDGSNGPTAITNLVVRSGDVLKLEFVSEYTNAGDFVGVNLTVTAVPEPATLGLLAAGLALLRRKRASEGKR
jgi:probable HAF family extracellular repeat protein